MLNTLFIEEDFHGNHWLQRPVAVLMFLFPLVAVSVKHGGSTVFALLLLLSLVFGWRGWGLLSVAEKRVLGAFAVFALVSLLSFVNADEFSQSAKQLERFARILAIVPMYCLLKWVGVRTARYFLWGVAFGACVLAVQATMQIFIIKNLDIAEGAYHKIIFGDTAILFSTVLAAALLTLNLKKWQVVFFSVGVLAGIYASILSMTRQAWLLPPVILLLWLWMYRDTLSRKGWLVIGGCLLLGVSVLTMWQPAKITGAFAQGFQELKAYQTNPGLESSWGIRVNLWRDSMAIFAEHPLLGTGLGDLQVERQRLVNSGEAQAVFMNTNHAHSLYFHTLATQGLVGFAAMVVCILMLPLWLFYKGWRDTHEPWSRFYRVCGVSFIVAFAVFGFSEGWLTRNPFVNTYVIFLLVLMHSIMQDEVRVLATESQVNSDG